MRRAIANILAAACLVLFVVVGFMWVRGYVQAADHVRWEDRGGFRGLFSSRGSVAVYAYDWPVARTVSAGWTWKTSTPIDIAAAEAQKAVVHRSFIGFHFLRDIQPPPSAVAGQRLRGWCLVVPYWFFALLFGLLPLGRFFRMVASAPRRPRPSAPTPEPPAA
jgi:hypothetical protein